MNKLEALSAIQADILEEVFALAGYPVEHITDATYQEAALDAWNDEQCRQWDADYAADMAAEAAMEGIPLLP